MTVVLPEVQRLTETESRDETFATAYLADGHVGIDLTAHGYIEEEFLVSGTANVYDIDDDGMITIAVASVLYTTRLLVRRPAEARRFSGRLFFEGLHPTNDGALSWEQIHPWLVRSGHAWAGVTLFGMAVDTLKAFDPVHYADIALPNDGLRWDILTQVGALLRSPTSPLGATVERCYASGWSYTGCLWRTFIVEGFHEKAQSVAGPTFDGYVLGITSGATMRGVQQLNPDAGPRPLDDPRRIVRGYDVPIIEMMSESEAEVNEAARREDSDEPGDRYRFYEVAGTGHINPTDPPRVSVANRQLIARGLPVHSARIKETPNRFPMGAFVSAAFANLDQWVTEGIAPPRALRFAYGEYLPPEKLYRAASGRALVRDVHGNAVGGVRSPHLDVPVASYFPHSTAILDGPGRRTADGVITDAGHQTAHKVPFTNEKLRALYGSPEHYGDLVAQRTAELVRDGWLLQPEAGKIVADAREVRF